MASTSTSLPLFDNNLTSTTLASTSTSNNNSKTDLVIVTRLPHHISDDDLRYLIQQLVPASIVLHSITIRAVKRSDSIRNCAFILVDNDKCQDVMNALDYQIIGGLEIRASINDLTRRKTKVLIQPKKIKMIEKISPPRNQSDSNSSNIQPFHHNPLAASPANCTEEEFEFYHDLLRLYISPLPFELSDLELFHMIDNLLKAHFLNTGRIKIRRTLKNAMAFADLYSYSEEANETIMSRIRRIDIEGKLLSIVHQKNPLKIDFKERFLLGKRKGSSRLDIKNNSRNQAEDFNSYERFSRSISPPSHPSKRPRFRSRSPERTYSERSVSRPISRSRSNQHANKRSSSPDPFDVVSSEAGPSLTSTSTKLTNKLSSLSVSLDDPVSLDQLAKPIHSPSNLTSFNRTVSTQLSFGYLSIYNSQLALASSTTSPFSNQEELQLQYEKFLISQLEKDNTEHYFNLLEKVGKFSKKNKLFSEIAEALVDLDDGI